MIFTHGMSSKYHTHQDLFIVQIINGTKNQKSSKNFILQVP